MRLHKTWRRVFKSNKSPAEYGSFRKSDIGSSPLDRDNDVELRKPDRRTPTNARCLEVELRSRVSILFKYTLFGKLVFTFSEIALAFSRFPSSATPHHLHDERTDPPSCRGICVRRRLSGSRSL